MKKFFGLMFALLGITDFAQNEDGKKYLTDEQKNKMTESFGTDFVAQFEASMNEDTDGATATQNPVTADMYAKSLGILTDKLVALESERAKLAAGNTTLEADKVANASKITDLTGLIATLSQKAETDPNATKGTQTETYDAMNDKFLFGIEKPFMAIDESRPYNKRAFAALAFKSGISVPTPKASSMDYSSLKSDLGDFYRIRKQEGIQSFLMKLTSLEEIFPLQSGYQDRAVLVNIFLEGEFSQADNSSSNFDSVVKGGFKFEPEELRMYDVMFSHKFTNLKELEKQWIGYLNKEGSSSMKWSFVEFILVETGKKLHNEREQRRINGKRKNPTLNVPGQSMDAADGLREFVNKKIAGLQINPFQTVGEWNTTNAVDIIQEGTSLVPKWIRDTGLLRVYVSSEFKTAYNAILRTINGMNQDYKGGIDYVLDYDNVKLVVVPNLAPSKRIIWTVDSNFSLYEDIPGEMSNFSLEQQDWSLKIWSQWRESVWASMVGKKMATAADFPEDYSSQMIWCNNADLSVENYIPMVVDDATPSVADHKSLMSVVNSSSVAITNIDDAVTGDEIRIKCGSTSKGITIAKSGYFSLISAEWTPVKGEIIYLKKRSDGKFIELKRITESTAAIAFADGDATPSLSGSDKFITVANTAALAITNFTDVVTSKEYTIYGGSNTNSSTIADAGNFVLTDDMTLSVGSWIKIQKAADGKFYEIERNV
jgi:hypothetical protein